MKISAKGEYAILAMLDLAKHYDSDDVRTLEQISTEQCIPHPFLVQILLELKKSNFVESRRGAGGGYRLSRPAREISLGEVICLIDGPLLPFKCTVPMNESACECAHHGSCVLTPVWEDVRHAIEGVVNGISFEELVQRNQALKPALYQI
jgi:Rrf2 family protein